MADVDRLTVGICDNETIHSRPMPSARAIIIRLGSNLEFEVYCEGLEAHETRELSVEEREIIEKRSNRRLLSIWSEIIALPILLIGGIVSATLASDTTDSPWGYLALVLFIIWFVCMAWVLLRVRDRLRERRLLRLARPDSRVFCFEKFATPDEVGHMVREPLLLDQFTVLEHSQVRMKRKGKWLRVFQPCPLTFVASAPPTPKVDEKRVLTDAELLELSTYIRQARKPKVIFWIFAVWSTFAILALATNSPRDTPERIRAWVVIAVFIGCVIQFVLQRRWRRALMECHSEGLAMAAYDWSSETLYEVLLPTLVVWRTPDGPAYWRRHPLND